MWIKEALSHPPAGARLSIFLTWVRSVALAVAALAFGWTIDVWGTTETSVVLPLILAALAAVIGAAAGAWAESQVPLIAAREERGWRQRVLEAGLNGTLKPAPTMHGRPMDPQGQMVDAATTGVEKTANYRAIFLGPTLAAFSAPVMVLIVWAVGISWVSALILTAFVALVPVVIIVAGKFLRGSSATYRRKEAQANADYLEMIEGLGTFKILGSATRMRSSFASSARSAMQELSGLLVQNQRMIVVNDLVFALLMGAAAVGLLLWQFNAGTITVGQAVAGVLLTVLLNEPIDKVGRTFYVGLAGRMRRDQLDQMLPEGSVAQQPKTQTTPENDAPATTQPSTPSTATNPTVSNTSGVGIQLRNVQVSHGNTAVLDGIDLDIPAGAHVAVVGPSGAGKSTLLAALSGTVPSTGEILANNQAHSDLALLATVVSQQVELTSTTIRDNLLLARPNATDNELMWALNKAAFPMEPHQLDEPIGDAGALLSGGQRRRIGLAQAFLRDTPILLLDEATADLDRATEALVVEALQELAHGKTVIHVMHRLDLARHVDQVVVLENGKVSAVGTADELTTGSAYFATATTAQES